MESGVRQVKTGLAGKEKERMHGKHCSIGSSVLQPLQQLSLTLSCQLPHLRKYLLRKYRAKWKITVC